MTTVSAADLEEFATFVEEAEPLRRAWPAQCLEFAALADEAPGVVAEHLRRSLQENRAELEELCRWVVPPESDVFTAAGLGGDETSCTRLVAWMLFPPDQPEIALCCQREWLAALGRRDVSNKVRAPAMPKLELRTEDGRADLILHYDRPEYLLIVEAKLGSEEHLTPGGGWQTSGYPAAVRATLELSPQHAGDLVFLTPNGRDGVDANAIPATYEGLVSAVTRALSSLPSGPLPPDLRWAYSAVLTHLLVHATRSGTSSAGSLRLIRRWLSQADTLTDERILADVETLGPLCRSIASRRSP